MTYLLSFSCQSCPHQDMKYLTAPSPSLISFHTKLDEDTKSILLFQIYVYFTFHSLIHILLFVEWSLSYLSFPACWNLSKSLSPCLITLRLCSNLGFLCKAATLLLNLDRPILAELGLPVFVVCS